MPRCFNIYAVMRQVITVDLLLGVSGSSLISSSSQVTIFVVFWRTLLQRIDWFMKSMSLVLSQKKIIEIIIDLKKRLLKITFCIANQMIFLTLHSPSQISNIAMHRLFDFTSSPIKSKQAILSSSVRYWSCSVLPV